MKAHGPMFQRMLAGIVRSLESVPEHRNGKLHTYRWVEQVPIRAGAKALQVTWCEVTVVREDTGKRLYHSAWITSHELTRETVPEVVAAGRAHWQIDTCSICRWSTAISHRPAQGQSRPPRKHLRGGVDVGKLATTTPAPAFPPNQIQNRATCEFDFRPLGDGTIKAERFNQSWMIDRSEVERIKAL